MEQEQGATEKKVDLESKTKQLESDNKRLKEEFNAQRARLKELFLQKEDELARKNKECSLLKEEVNSLKTASMTVVGDLDTQKQHADDEIATLQQLIHETVEASSASKTMYDDEIKKLQATIHQLQNDILELRREKQQSPHHGTQEQTSLAPGVMLSAVTKTLARKLGADTFGSPDKVNDDHGQEDVEVLRSLIIPLEEEIKALKYKLRTTDEQLQQCRKIHTVQDDGSSSNLLDLSSPSRDAENLLTTSSTDASTEPQRSVVPCDMCTNYEVELVKEQKKVGELEGKVSAAEKATERHREELVKEIGFRKEIEEKWNEKKEEHKQQVAELTRKTECAEQDLKELQQLFKQTCNEVHQLLGSLTLDREKVHDELLKLQKENEHLVGKYSIHSQQLQSEMINLPNTVQELHEVTLRLHQDLIIAKIGKEEAEAQSNSLRSDIVFLKEEISNNLRLKDSIEHTLGVQIETIKSDNDKLQKEKDILSHKMNQIHKIEKTNKEMLAQLDDFDGMKRKLEEQNKELKSRISSLQQELENSEAVQQDFVRLSQHLQVQLEKIRDSDIQVRWQHEEDVEDCQTCHTAFAVSKCRKQHCKHCGQIFCMQCLSRSVNSGPNQRPSKVCEVCHTLLVKSSAPYFSTEAPHSPD